MDLYTALHALGFGLHESPSAAQVKKAYYKIVLLKHPDKGGDPDEFVRIQEAMRLLTGANTESDVSAESEARRLYDDISNSLARGDLITANCILPSFWERVGEVASYDQKAEFCEKLSDRLMIHCDAALAQLDSTDDVCAFAEHILAVDLSGICPNYVFWFKNAFLDKVDTRVQDIETMRREECEAEKTGVLDAMLQRVREACANAELATEERQSKGAVRVLRAAAEAKGRELDAAAAAHAASLNQNLRDAEALMAAQEECDRLAAVYQASFEREERDRAAMYTIAEEKEQAEAELAAAEAHIAANKRVADDTGMSHGGKRVKVWAAAH